MRPKLNPRAIRRWFAKLFTAVITLGLFFALVLLGISSFLLYRVIYPETGSIASSPENLPGHPRSLSYNAPDGSQREGWFFPGHRFAPVVILCHGYRSHMGEVFTLATALQEGYYNVLVFDFTGHGTLPKGRTSFGFAEKDEVLAAFLAVAQRDDIDPNRFGIWGIDQGAYAALSAAAVQPRVRALVLDSLYDQPTDLLDIEVRQASFGHLPFVERITHWGFELLNYGDRKVTPLHDQLASLHIPKLFIQSNDRPPLADSTVALFQAAPDPKEDWWAPEGSYIRMMNQSKREYENRVLTFFLLNLPLSAPVPASK